MPHTSAKARRGLLVRARWQDQWLDTRWLSADGAGRFTVGSNEGCDFALGGVASLALAEWTHDGGLARLSPKMAKALWSNDGEVPLEGRLEDAGDGTTTLSLHAGERLVVQAGALTFELEETKSPPPTPLAWLENVDYRYLNVLAVLVALFGAVVVTGVVAEEAQLGENDLGHSAKVLKTLVKAQVPAPQQRSSGGDEGARSKRESKADKPSKPSNVKKPGPSATAKTPTSAKGLLTGVFDSPAMGGVLKAGSLGQELRDATRGLQANAGGFGGMGLRDTGGGFGGGKLEGIGGLGTRGVGGGEKGYGIGVVCEGKQCKKKDVGPSIDSDPPEIIGGLDKELIRKVIKANLGGIRACYEHRLTSKPTVGGTVAVKFAINPAGLVVSSTVARTTTDDETLETCVSNRVRALVFPTAGRNVGMTVVTYPFVFKRAGE